MATANTGEGGSVRPWLRRSLSVNDAVPLKTRMYSAWYRFRYGELYVHNGNASRSVPTTRC